MEEPGSSILDLISASNIAYVICLVKNSGEVWKQELHQDENEDKVKLLFTTGEWKKWVSGETVWSKVGQDYYYGALTNWHHAYDMNNA
jgi:hypothetical protein